MESIVKDILLTPVLQRLIDATAALTKERFSLLMGVEEEIENLSKQLLLIQQVIKGAEENPLNQDKVDIWLKDLKHLAYDAEDVLDEFATEATLQPMKGATTKGFMGRKVSPLIGEERVKVLVHCKAVLRTCFLSCCCTSSPNTILLRLRIANNIKAIGSSIQVVLDRKKELQLHTESPSSTGEQPPIPISSKGEDGPLLEAQFELIGRDDVRDEIIKLLRVSDHGESDSYSPKPNVTLIPIVGMGGLGKTTLAQVIFNDKSVAGEFSYKKWLSVGENFNAELLIKKLIAEPKEIDSSIGDLQEKLKDKIEKHKFLIVLDDVWEESPGKIEKLWIPLTHGKKGSNVIITTRIEEVIKATGHDTPRRLQPLSNEQCFKIFEKYAFVGGKSDKYPTLKEIGWEIVANLKGLPLAAKVVGRTLCGNSDENKWKSFLENKVWIDERESTEGIMPTLRWSYRHLPSHLKQCFMYCSIFPKDFLFDKEDLVLKWMAVGFVQPKGTRRLEEIGGNYFDDLLYRSFFEITNGEYKMHDLIHDLAQSLSQDECKTVTDEVKVDGILENMRHLSFACNQEEKHNAALQECKKSRTIWIQNHSLPKNSFTNLRCMRVLDLYSNKIEELPDTIGELKLLRYLNIGWCLQLQSLPESMCNLYNLQTLKMEEYSHSLPTGMSKLINLRHLKAREDLVSQVAGIGKLASLQNLGLFDVSTESGRRISELRDMKELRGSLTIKRLQHVGSGNEAAEANMKEKRHLEELILRWDLNSNTTSKREEVLDALKPHAGLKLLEISDYVGFQPPSWMVEVTGLKSLRLLDCKQLTDVEVPVSLEELKLQGCDMLRSIPPLHQLTKIKILDIRWCAKLTVTDHVKEEEAAMSFPSLKYLAIDVGVLLSKILRRYDLIGLEEMQITTYLPRVEDEEGSRWQRLISLQKLGLHDCHVLLPLVHWIPSLKNLEITGRRGLPSMAEVRLPYSLEILTVKDWDNLLALPEELHCLPSLRELLIKGCSQIHSMAEYKLPSSLKVLSFIHCEELLSLPAQLHRLPSLRKLELSYCKQLQSLPEGGLPESLLELKIKDCPILQKRCQEDGPDWPKIKHIHI